MLEIMNANLLKSPDDCLIPDVFVKYDEDRERFEVIYTATNSGYFVKRGSLVDDLYKYMGPIVEKILEGCIEAEEDLNVFFSWAAYEEILKIWMANCVLF